MTCCEASSYQVEVIIALTTSGTLMRVLRVTRECPPVSEGGTSRRLSNVVPILMGRVHVKDDLDISLLGRPVKHVLEVGKKRKPAPGSC